MKVIASIEARMGASRLPGKTLADIAGRPVLLCIIERLRMAGNLDGIIVATTKAPEDEMLASVAAQAGVPVFRGSQDDVLKRVLEAQQSQGSDVVVEICGDCPLLDPDIVDQAVATFLANDCDLVATGAKQSFPQGTEVHVFQVDALAEIVSITNDPAHREHVALYFHEHPERYRIIHLMAPAILQRPEQRLQLDYPEDLDLVRQVYTALMPEFGLGFRTADILHFLDNNPEIARLNNNCVERLAR